MKLMTLKQYMGMSKPALIRKITKTLRAMPKAKLARLCYNMTKSKLPRLKINGRKVKDLNIEAFIHAGDTSPAGRKRFKAIIDKREKIKRRISKRKTKRKFSKKQLAAQRLFAKRARAGTLRR